jgi:hypothetical protein
VLFLRPENATTKAFFNNRKIQAVEALQDTGRWLFCQLDFLDIDTTLGYPSRFLSGVVETARVNAGGVAQLGERLNGIQEVRGSIPLTSMAEVAAENGCLFAGIAQLVEHNLAKVGVAGSSPVSRSLVRGGAVSSVG